MYKVYHVGFDILMFWSTPAPLSAQAQPASILHGCAGLPGSVTADVASTVRSFFDVIVRLPRYLSTLPPPHTKFRSTPASAIPAAVGSRPSWLLVAPRLDRIILTASRAIANSPLSWDSEKKSEEPHATPPPESDPTALLSQLHSR